MKKRTKSEQISDVAKRRKENNSVDFNLSVRGSKLYLRARHNNSVSLEIDVTQVFNFAKEILQIQENIVENKRGCCYECWNSEFALKGKNKEKMGCGLACECHLKK